MSIGYACLIEGLNNSSYKTIRKENITNEKLINIIDFNLDLLERMIDYNISNDIKLFRITSDLIPFGSSLENKIDYQTLFRDKFQRISSKIKENNIRVTMHPGQYTVLNSPNMDVVHRSIEDLIYHAKVLESLETDDSSKLILHIGGIYGNKEEAINRFIKNFNLLPENVKKRLIIENDERCFNIEDVLYINKHLNIPVVFDNLHHNINKPNTEKEDFEWIDICSKTWKNYDGIQKVHYSEQDQTKQIGAHSKTINHQMFLDWYSKLKNKNIDIMLEVKDKNLSAIKIKNCIDNLNDFDVIEITWAKYKYLVLSKSNQLYSIIDREVKNKNIDMISLYDYIESALDMKSDIKNQIYAINIILNKLDLPIESKNKINKKVEAYSKNKIKLETLKKSLLQMIIKSGKKELQENLYFYI